MNCRLCDKAVVEAFSKIVLNKYDVKYFRCTNCNSLQTEVPYWIDEAYAQGNLTSVDTGVVQRCFNSFTLVYILSALTRAKGVLDIGGGDGLLTRLLRDFEIDAVNFDKYAIANYSSIYTKRILEYRDIFTAFEVFEHFVEPKVEYDIIFSFNPKLIVASTVIYRNEEENWWYLLNETGQHLFFYSEEAIRQLSKKYGYEVVVKNGYIVFHKKSKYFASLIKLLTNRRILKLLRAIVFLFPTRGSKADFIRKSVL